MLEHLIEVALPLKEVSEQSARKESIRHVRTEMEKRPVPPHLSRPRLGKSFKERGLAPRRLDIPHDRLKSQSRSKWTGKIELA